MPARMWVVAACALATLSACGSSHITDTGPQAQGARSQTDDSQACLDAINAANFMPNFAQPEHAQQDARARIVELGELAARTTNVRLRQNLLDVEASVRQVADGSVTIENSDDWSAAQLDKYQAITTTCSELAAG